MTPFEVLHYVRNSYRHHWEKKVPNKSALIKILGVGTLTRSQQKTLGDGLDQNLSPASHGWTPFRDYVNGEHAALRKALGLNRALAPADLPALAQALERPGLFSLTTQEQVDAAMAELLQTTKPKARFLDSDTFDAAAAAHLTPTPAELKALKKLGRILKKKVRNTSVISVDFAHVDGSSILAFMLVAGLAKPPEGVNRVYLLQPDDLDCTYDAELEALYAHVQSEQPDMPRNKGEATGAWLLRALQSQGALVLLLDGYLLKTRIGSLAESFLTAASEPRAAGSTPSVVLFGAPKHRLITVNETPAKAECELTDPDEIQERLMAHFSAYSAFRDNQGRGTESDLAGQSDFRPVWWSWLISNHPEQKWLEADLRVISYFATNRTNLSFYDPTLGWERLAGVGDADLPPELQLLRKEWENYARHLKRTEGKQVSSLMVARALSTAVFWLREDTLKELFRAGGTFKKGSTHSGRKLVEKVAGVSIGKDSAKHTLYYLPFGLRAVLQSHWIEDDLREAERRKNEDPGEDAEKKYWRAEVHYTIAIGLYYGADDLSSVQAEYPVGPHQDGAKLFLTTEVIRHFVRSLPTPGQIEHARQSDFGTPHWTAPGELLHYLYNQLLEGELNDNIRDRNYRLSKHFGAYRVASEIYDMLWPFLKDAVPPWLDIHEFRLGRAIFQMEFGALESATEALRAVGAELDENAPQWPRLHLHLALAEQEAGNETGAQESLDKARAALESHPPAADLKLNRRLLSRGASLALMANRTDLALDLAHKLVQLEDGQIPLLRPEEELPQECRERQRIVGKLEGDEAHVAIKCLLDETEAGVTQTADMFIGDRPRKLEAALYLCQRNMRRERKAHRRHSELGFQVQRARCYRMLGMLDACEEELDESFELLYHFGCSERTYHSLMVEAGQLLLQRGFAAKAYVQYLRPGFLRARRTGFRARGSETAKVALDALLVIEKDLGQCRQDKTSWPARLASKMSEAQFGLESDQSEKDKWQPFSNYVLPKDEEGLEAIANHKNIEDEKRQLEDYLAEQ